MSTVEQGDGAATTAPIEQWGTLVARVKAGEEAGLEELYTLFNRGIRYYLCRRLGPEELEDRLHDTFLIVVKTIQRGDLRNPECLMGFVRTVVRRQAAHYIETAVHNRKEQADLESSLSVADRKNSPEQEAIVRERAEIMRQALGKLSERDRDILVRFYVLEQKKEQICSDLNLTETQFRLWKSRAKSKLGHYGAAVLRPTAWRLIAKSAVVGEAVA